MSGVPSPRREVSDSLVERIRGGDKRAFESLFNEFHPSLCAFAYGFVQAHDVAEELVQEVFLFVWERRETWDVRGSVKSYLFTAVRNAALSQLRHERIVRRHESESVPLQARESERADADVLANDAALAIRKAIDALPPKCREVFILNRQHGMSHDQIAALLGISPKTIENQMSRALRLLKEALAPFRH